MGRVLAQLENRLGADATRELRVGGRICPRPPRTRRLDAEQEVGAAHPAAVKKCGLVDDVVPLAHRRDGVGFERAQFGRGAGIPVALILERPDPQPLRPERVEVTLLVRGAEGGEDLAERGPIARYRLSGRDPPLQGHEVTAGQVVAQVGGRVHRTAVLEESHQRTILARGRVRSRASGRVSWRLRRRRSAPPPSCGGPGIPASRIDRAGPARKSSARVASSA